MNLSPRSIPEPSHGTTPGFGGVRSWWSSERPRSAPIAAEPGGSQTYRVIDIDEEKDFVVLRVQASATYGEWELGSSTSLFMEPRTLERDLLLVETPSTLQQRERELVFETRVLAHARTSLEGWAKGGTYRLDGSPPWLLPVAEKLERLLRLQPGWDSYRALPITTEAVRRVESLLRHAMRVSTPVPSIVPLAQGGIQLEWHLRGMNIEVTVPAEGAPVEVWWEDLRSGDEHEFTLDEEPGTLREVLAELTRRS